MSVTAQTRLSFSAMIDSSDIPVRTALDKANHDRKKTPWLQSPPFSDNGWDGQEYGVFP
jgi:hypothetical protein